MLCANKLLLKRETTTACTENIRKNIYINYSLLYIKDISNIMDFIILLNYNSLTFF